MLFLKLIDWDDSATDLAHLGDTAPGATKSDKLWEDNWDDDDVEDDFSVQLRWVHSCSCYKYPVSHLGAPSKFHYNVFYGARN